MSRNLAASVRARLKQHADATKQDFNLTLTHYGLERLLAVVAGSHNFRWQDFLTKATIRAWQLTAVFLAQQRFQAMKRRLSVAW